MRPITIGKKITSRDPVLEKYLEEIGKIELISPEEEVELARKIKQGDESALEKLTKANLRFVVSVAKQYQREGLELKDLINDGNFGLIKAAQRFDETRGFKFISYAVWWIRQSILEGISETSTTIRFPANMPNKKNKVDKIYNLLEQEYEREPTNEEVLGVFGKLSKEEKEFMQYKKMSLDYPLGYDEKAGTLLDVLSDKSISAPDKKIEYYDSLKEEVDRTLNSFSSRETKIMRMSFGIGYDRAYKPKEISEEFRLNGEKKLSGERVRQLKEKIIKKLRNGSYRKRFQQYLG